MQRRKQWLYAVPDSEFDFMRHVALTVSCPVCCCVLLVVCVNRMAETRDLRELIYYSDHYYDDKFEYRYAMPSCGESHIHADMLFFRQSWLRKYLLVNACLRPSGEN